ncbi:probable caffeoyl-CoA O-methyltransferase 2 isoform X4 [Portunus trituberculatus]|uniref:probable caffeoyl-CoA O-methyltransferase 2 isoform X4 n=1 Tax=Portunus trituberculatus TaxID=210409 RepID=UPI001E1CBA98|nr:probable caffeoyl-CoA O-methyltransferase 2 isoform X4 [Portunus trituberculatus]
MGVMHNAGFEPCVGAARVSLPTVARAGQSSNVDDDGRQVVMVLPGRGRGRGREGELPSQMLHRRVVFSTAFIAKMAASLKSYDSKDPLVKYTADHSLRFTEAQKNLMELTFKLPKYYMLGAPEVLQLNANLIRTMGGKKVLDVGVYTGASALSAALALPPDGEVHALDLTDENVNLGRKFWSEDGVADKIHVHIGPATDTLQQFIDEGQAGTFDFAFIDADKPNFDRYYEQCLVLVRRGGIIAFDNTVLNGRVLDPDDQKPDAVAVRKLNKKLRDDQRIYLSFLKIGDGLSLCFIK